MASRKWQSRRAFATGWSGTVITVAHRLSTMIDADRIIVMEEGRVRDQGTHAELLERDALYREQVEALRIAERDQEVAEVA